MFSKPQTNARPPRPGREAGPDAPGASGAVSVLPQGAGNLRPAVSESVLSEPPSGTAEAGDLEARARQVYTTYCRGVTNYYAQETKVGWAYVPQPLTLDHIKQHLEGSLTLGVYPIDDHNEVRWVAWDFDDDSVAQVYRLTSALKGPFTVVASGGPHNGRHVFQFLAQPYPAFVARGYARSCCRAAGLDPDTVECYPKQDKVGPKAPGQNLLRLPFGVSVKTGRRSVVEYEEAGTITLPTFAPQEINQALSTGVLEGLAGGPSYLSPLEKLGNGPFVLKGHQHGSEPREQGWIAETFAGEAPQGRNNALRRLAFWLGQKGLPGDVVRFAVLHANSCMDPPLDVDEVERTVLRDV